MGFLDNKDKNVNIELDDESARLKKSIKEVQDSLNEILARIEKKVSFDEFSDIVSREIDNEIIEQEKDGNLSFVGGSCTFKITGFIKKCSTEAELYFRSCDNKWTRVSMNGNLSIAKFTEEAVKNELSDIEKSKGIKIEIVHP